MRLPLIALVLTSFLVPAVAHGQAGASRAFAFPETAPGRQAQAWFAAYAAGEDALRAFWIEHGSPAALAQRPVEPRLAFMRQVRQDQGGLAPVRVTEDGEDFCEVVARAEHGEMVRIRFLCEPDAKHMLTGLRLERADDEGSPGPAGRADPSVGGPQGGAPAPGAAPPTDATTPDGPPPTDAQLVQALSAKLDTLQVLAGFSGAVVLDKDGHTLFARAAGMASRTPRRLNTLETRFNLGSLNKIVTHVAIEHLAQAGKLRLEDPVTRWLPDYKVPGAQRITLRMLLDHRGGVPDMFANPAYDGAAARLHTMTDWYALVRDMPLRFEPGARQEYSNGGFVLLGMVVARASGMDYHAYVSRRVYAPAGMTRSGHVAADSLGADAAIGYTRDARAPEAHAGDGTPPGLAANTASLPGRGSSAGGGYATAGDLVRFANALRAGRLLDAAHVRDVFGEHFSLGLAGGSPGVNALFVVAGPYTLVVLANLDPPAAEQFAPAITSLVRRAAGVPAPARR